MKKIVSIGGNLNIWRPPSLSELTPMLFNMGLTHLGSETSIYTEYLYIYSIEMLVKSLFLNTLSKNHRQQYLATLSAILCLRSSKYTFLLSFIWFFFLFILRHINLRLFSMKNFSISDYLEASDPKWVNPDYI